MLHNIEKFYGLKLGATDGEIGQVKDFYFDDKTWALRYLVADTGTWLPGRLVLLSPHAFSPDSFGRFHDETKVISVKLTRKKIENSPSIDLHRPVSRQYEEDYYAFYGWPTYWKGDISSADTVPGLKPVAHGGHTPQADIHLRSTHSLAGYRIKTTNGQMGSISGFMVDGKSWTIRELIVETGHWYSTKTVLILPESVERISYEDSAVFVKLTTEEIEQTPRNDVAQASLPC